jgi:hypothetical protein
MFNQKGKRKGRDQRLKDQRFYILFETWEIHTIKRDTSKKFGARPRWLTIQKFSFHVSPNLSGGGTGLVQSTGFVRSETGFQRWSHQLPKSPIELVQWWHQTSPINQTCLVWDRLLESTSLASREVHQTYPVVSPDLFDGRFPQWLFWGGDYK